MSQWISCNLRKLYSCMSRRCGGVHSESGNALVEFTLLLAFALMPLMIGVSDLAPVIYGYIELANASQAGALAAAIDGSTDNITAKVQQDMPYFASDFVVPKGG